MKTWWYEGKAGLYKYVSEKMKYAKISNVCVPCWYFDGARSVYHVICRGDLTQQQLVLQRCTVAVYTWIFSIFGHDRIFSGQRRRGGWGGHLAWVLMCHTPETSESRRTREEEGALHAPVISRHIAVVLTYGPETREKRRGVCYGWPVLDSRLRNTRQHPTGTVMIVILSSDKLHPELLYCTCTTVLLEAKWECIHVELLEAWEYWNDDIYSVRKIPNKRLSSIVWSCTAEESDQRLGGNKVK